MHRPPIVRIMHAPTTCDYMIRCSTWSCTLYSILCSSSTLESPPAVKAFFNVKPTKDMPRPGAANTKKKTGAKKRPA
jgi:hypothetical protein